MISVINYSSGIDTFFSGVCSMKNTVALYYYFCGTQTIFGCKFPMTFLRALITQEPIKLEKSRCLLLLLLKDAVLQTDSISRNDVCLQTTPNKKALVNQMKIYNMLSKNK